MAKRYARLKNEIFSAATDFVRWSLWTAAFSLLLWIVLTTIGETVAPSPEFNFPTIWR